MFPTFIVLYILKLIYPNLRLNFNLVDLPEEDQEKKILSEDMMVV